MTNEPTAEIKLDDPQSFVQAITTVQGFAGSSKESSPIYRGVGDADLHSLIPTALREHAQDAFWSQASIAPISQNDEQRKLPQTHISAELEIVRAFYQASDISGLSLPPLPTDFESMLRLPMVYSMMQSGGVWHQCTQSWPPPQIRPIVALALSLIHI